MNVMRFVKDNPIMLGGPNVVVEIDEAKFGRRKDNKGRIIDGQWILGGVERGDISKCFYVLVPNRTKETLQSVI